ncbi:MAG TPA: hypothetical protein ENK06_05950 [Gammaproteobacteria bacterium]|nr:hypothetical protein [Gammaproteobacteria bacterium]
MENKNEFETYCVNKIDAYLSEHNIKPNVKRKFRETKEIYGTVYKFSHFGIEVSEGQVLIFGKYKSTYFDKELYENKDKLLEVLLPAILEHYNNPALTKHPIIRFFNRLKGR